MDDFLDNHTANSDILQEQKKIVIKNIKEKRGTRTYLYNIDHWLEADEITSVGKNMKRQIGTSSQMMTDDDGTALTFRGDHTQDIKSVLIKHSNGKITAKSFA